MELSAIKQDTTVAAERHKKKEGRDKKSPQFWTLGNAEKTPYSYKLTTDIP